MTNTYNPFTTDSNKWLAADPDNTKPEGPGLNGIVRPLHERITHPLTKGIRDYQPPVRGISLDHDGVKPHHGASSRQTDRFDEHCITRARHEVLLSVVLTRCKTGVRSLGWEGVILRQHFGSAFCVPGGPGQPPVQTSIHDGVTVATRIGKVNSEDIADRCLQDRILCVVNHKFVRAHATYLGFGVCPEAPGRAVVRITVPIGRKHKPLTFTLGLLPGVEQPWTF